MKNPLIPSFPEISARIFPLIRSAYERGVQRARSLWNEGWIPEALAGNPPERTRKPCRSLFCFPRQKAEQSLGFEFTQDEKWRPRMLLLPGSLSLLILPIFWSIRKFWPFVSKRKEVTSNLVWGYRSIAITLIVIAGVVLFALIKGILNQDHRKIGSAVLRAAVAYRVPDEDSGVNTRFNEGQLVIIRSTSASWAYVESLDGKLGWILRDKVLYIRLKIAL